MSAVVPFGKYKGQAVEVMAADREYCDWLSAQPWFRDRFRDVYNVVINYGAEPQDTPEHNALQAMFLDDEFCIRVAAAAAPDWFDVDGADAGDTWESERKASARRFDAPVTISHRAFEAEGWDVHVQFRGGRSYEDPMYLWSYGPRGPLLVECKPVVGDDYPSVLRQVRRCKLPERGLPVVLVDHFCASNVDLAAVRRMFGGVKLITLAQVLP
jgi:hypothetical protein